MITQGGGRLTEPAWFSVSEFWVEILNDQRLGNITIKLKLLKSCIYFKNSKTLRKKFWGKNCCIYYIFYKIAVIFLSIYFFQTSSSFYINYKYNLFYSFNLICALTFGNSVKRKNTLKFDEEFVVFYKIAVVLAFFNYLFFTKTKVVKVLY